jgi:dienelactone hydrolase
MSHLALRVVISWFFGFLMVGGVSAETPRVLPKGQLPQDKRLGNLIDLDGYFPFTPCDTPEAWQKRAAEVRRRVLVSAGLWPMPEKTPNHAVIHGKVERDGYTVERVFFESYPGFYVTGSLYRPKGKTGRLPAVLSPYGHWSQGRFYEANLQEFRQQIADGAERFEDSGRYPLQARCVQLARMGCVVFHYDMVGRPDSKQLPHYEVERDGLNTPEKWGFFSPQAESRMQTIFGLQTYDSIRALDFLSELPDVDPARIAVTGASGGGTQTFILGAVDPRPAVLCPVNMVSTTMQGGCVCENGSYLRIGTGNVEFAALCAPKPLALICSDDWTKEIPTKGLPELKQIYRMFGAEELVAAKPFLQFPHNYNYVSREAMYHWLNKHLKLGLEEPIIEEDFRPLSVAEMTVWDEKHPAPPSGPEFEASLCRSMADAAQRQIDAIAPKDETSLQEYRRIVGGAVEVMVGRGLPESTALTVADAQSEDFESWHMTKFLLKFPAQGEELPVLRLDPKNWNHRVAIWIDRLGKNGLFTSTGSLRPSVQKLLENGYVVLGADLFGQGEFTQDGTPLTKTRIWERPNNPITHYAGLTFGYNSPAFVQRVHDILSLVSFARSKEVAASHVDVLGLNGAGPWVAMARAVAQKAIDNAAIDTAGFRFANIASIDHPDFLPGGAKYDDLPGLLALSAPSPLWIAGEAPSTARIADAYEASKNREALSFWQGNPEQQEPAAIEWLLKHPKQP